MILFISDHIKHYFDSSKPLFEQCMSIDGTVHRALENRRTVSFSFENETYFIKQHFGVGWREIFKNLCFLRLPIISAKNEWRAIKKLQAEGFHVPEVLAYGERGVNPARKQSFVLMREFKHKIPLFDYFQKNKPEREFCERLATGLGALTRKLHALQMNHRDYYVYHICLDENALKNNQLQFFIYDFHRTNIYKKMPTRWRIKDVAGLIASIEKTIAPVDDVLLNLFFDAYFDGDINTSQNQTLIRKIKKKC